MSDLLDQLPALLGVVVGTVGTILATHLADRARWARAQSVRWDERRMDAYADYARAIKELHNLAFRMTAARRADSRTQPLERPDGLRLLDRAEAHRTKAWEAALLLGDTETVAAARSWREAVRQFELLAQRPDCDLTGWDQGVRSADGARDAFYLAARRSLDIPGGSVVQSSWLSTR